MDKLTVKQQRVMMYFIEATEQIILTDGIENISIKKIAELAGYNSATIYNYFENLEELILYASIHYLKIYLQDLKKEIKDTMTSKEIYIKIYEIFTKHSFARPEIFNTLFFGKFSNQLEKVISKYYEIFPKEFQNQNDVIKEMLSQHDIYKRDIPLIEAMIKEGSISENKAMYIMESIIRVHHSFLIDLLNKNIKKDLKTYEEEFLRLFRFYLEIK